MLKCIHIQNFAIIDNLQLDLPCGLIALTGETGAGKSILIDAIHLSLGARAESTIIRPNCDKCEISIEIDVAKIPLAKIWLNDNEFVSNDECIIRRIIYKDGRSRSTINGHIVPLQMLRELAALLVDIYGQHEHQNLLKRDLQREWLDDFAGNGELCKNLNDVHQKWREVSVDLNNIKDQKQKARLELLQYHVQELEGLNLKNEEVENLEKEYKKLTNASQLIENCQMAVTKLAADEEVSALKLLYAAQQDIAFVAKFDINVANISPLLKNAIVHTKEASSDLQHYLERLEVDKERLVEIEKRLDNIYSLARKHQKNPNELLDLQNLFKKELDELTAQNERIIKLAENQEKLFITYNELAMRISQSRKAAAIKLEKQVSEKMQNLNMPGGNFKIEFSMLESTISAKGLDNITFMACTNPGQPLQPLAKIASGGELSRIALAIRTITAQKESTPTLIFDEVDVGIGGATAEIVGKLLRTLGENFQVFCITHLPQVAAQAHHHLKVEKLIVKEKTITKIQVLDREQRIFEIARMVGGVKITEQTLAHAKEMLAHD